MLSLASSELPTFVAVLKDTGLEQNLEAACRRAHQLKGAAGNVGGSALRSIAAEIERTAKAGDAAAVASLMPALELQALRLHDALTRWKR